MSEQERKYLNKFLDVAEKNGFSYNIVFAMCAVAFDKGTTEDESIRILRHLTELAAKYQNEDDFIAEVEKEYIN